MVKKKSDCVLGVNSVDIILIFLYRVCCFFSWMGGRDEICWIVFIFIRFFFVSLVFVGLGGGIYVEFFIFCDYFGVGEDGGRRVFGEWIS